MKNFKKVGIVLSLMMAIGLGSFVYASDFSTPEERYGHCYEAANKKEAHHIMRHHGRRHMR